MSKSEPTELMEEIGVNLFPRRYRRFKDLRPYQEACEWARKLDWRQNPYDRFLLRRELLHHLERAEFRKGRSNIFAFVSREEIAEEVDHLIDEFPEKYESVGVFGYVLVTLPWRLGIKHGLIRHNKLNEALAKLAKAKGKT